MVTLTSAPEIIETLGGIRAVSQLTGCTTGAIWNWKDRNVLPSKTYAVMKAALKDKGADAPASLWNMVEAL